MTSFRLPSQAPARWLFVLLTLFSCISIALATDDSVGLALAPSELEGTEERSLDYIPRATHREAEASKRDPGGEANMEIMARAPTPTVAPKGMEANTPVMMNAIPGPTNAMFYSYSIPTSNGARDSEADVDMRLDDISRPEELKKRQVGIARRVYISITTCLQPDFEDQQDKTNPPQLTLYVSTTSSNTNPGPNSQAPDQQQVIPLVEGFANFTASVASTVFLGVAGPDVRVSGVTAWNYQIAVSLDSFYHSYLETLPELFLIDADPNAALLITANLTNLAPDNSTEVGWNRWLNQTNNAPLDVFVANTNNTAVRGMMHSYCGLTNAPSVLKPDAPGYNKTINHNQPDKVPEQEFYVPGLNRTSSYYGILARTGNSTSSASAPGVVGGGGVIYKTMTFRTKRDQNCQVIYDLPFCNQVEYAVPANPFRKTVGDLKQLYDQQAFNLYKNFSLALQQIPCNITSSGQYSLVTNCTACASAYKTWLCAVTIPRCEDFTSGGEVQYPTGPADAVDDSPPPDTAQDPQWYLMPRNLAQPAIFGAAPIPGGFIDNSTLQNWIATNSSRNNDTIGGIIQPGPYHEVLPCEDLCFDLVRHCPASLGFGCPQPGSRMLRASYGARGSTSGGASTCSAPGVVYKENSGLRLETGVWWVMGVGLWLAWWLSDLI